VDLKKKIKFGDLIDYGPHYTGLNLAHDPKHPGYHCAILASRRTTYGNLDVKTLENNAEKVL